MVHIKNGGGGGGGKSKAFLCFGPVAIDDDSVKPRRKDIPVNPVLTCVPVGGNKSMMIPKILTSLSEDKLKFSDGDLAVGVRRRNERSRRSLCRVLKSMFLETSAAKKIRRRNTPKKSQSDLSGKSNKTSTSVKEKNRQTEQSPEPNHSDRTNSNCTSFTPATTSLRSSCASSITFESRSSRSNSMDSKQGRRRISTRKKVGEYYHSSNTGLCFLLISLLVLIFWGRACAVFCTSMWLFLASRSSCKVDPPANTADATGVDWGDHKKRVIMEGLLERQRGPP